MPGKRKGKSDVPETKITFDPASRYNFINGFRKRKQLRRKKAMMEILEKERQDGIDVRREVRDDAKRRFREVQAAEARIAKILGQPLNKALENGGQAAAGKGTAGARASRLGDGGADAPVERRASVLDFDCEDDDPFGGCEVTTTVVGADGLEGIELQPLLALPGIFDIIESGGAPNGEGGQLATARQPSEAEAHALVEQARRKRSISLFKEEQRRKAALAKRVKKKLEEKKRMKKTGKKSRKKGGPGSKKRRSAKERRKRPQVKKKKA